MTYDLYHKQNKRTYGLVRASNAGASPFPYVIYNDYSDGFINLSLEKGETAKILYG